jgi:hypothetical protein
MPALVRRRSRFHAVASGSLVGHAVGDATGLYQTRELLSWLAKDAEAASSVCAADGRSIDHDGASTGVALSIVAA